MYLGDKMKYNLKQNICGVYQIRNKINNKSYIGSSVNISGRFSNHMNRDARKYYWRDFYKDIMYYGQCNFEFIVLEECDKEKLIEREQYYYDLIKPEYNFTRPVKSPLLLKEINDLAHSSERYYKSIENRRRNYNTLYYKKLFSSIQNKRKKPVDIYKDDNFIISCESLSEAARYIENNTDFKGKNKVSKIKAVCDGERQTAYGYIFKYKV